MPYNYFYLIRVVAPTSIERETERERERERAKRKQRGEQEYGKVEREISGRMIGDESTEVRTRVGREGRKARQGETNNESGTRCGTRLRDSTPLRRESRGDNDQPDQETGRGGEGTKRGWTNARAAECAPAERHGRGRGEEGREERVGARESIRATRESPVASDDAAAPASR